MKKKFSLALSFILVFSLFSMPMYAANNQEYAEKLSIINVFKGTGNGYELDREPTRLEGLIMLIRLLGKEEAIQSYTTNVFTDVPEWGSKYANYAYENGLTKGIGDGKFGSNDLMNAQSYLTFMLRALGYDDSIGEFNWSTAIDDAYRLNVIDNQIKNELKTNTFLRDHVAQSSYLTLQSAVNGSNIKLIDKLVNEGAISLDAAEKMLADNQNIFEDHTIVDNIITDEISNVNPDEVNQTTNNNTSETLNSQIEILELDKAAEFVDIINNGNTDVNIGGWTLVSEKGHQTFVFPSGYTLKAGQVCRLSSGDLKGTGDFTMADTSIWNNSSYDPAVLYDGNGNEIDREEGHK